MDEEANGIKMQLSLAFVALLIANGYVNLLWPLAVLREWQPEFAFVLWPRGIRILLLLVGGGLGYLFGALLYAPMIRADADVQSAVHSAWAVFLYVLFIAIGIAFLEKSVLVLGPVLFFLGFLLLLGVLGPVIRAPAAVACVLVSAAALAAIGYVAF